MTAALRPTSVLLSQHATCSCSDLPPFRKGTYRHGQHAKRASLVNASRSTSSALFSKFPHGRLTITLGRFPVRRHRTPVELAVASALPLVAHVDDPRPGAVFQQRNLVGEGIVAELGESRSNVFDGAVLVR